MTDHYIVVNHWRRFQHYKDRNPPWIKNLTELLHDHNYLELSGRHRGILHGIWLLYAASNGELLASPARLSAMLGMPTEHEWRMVRARRVDGELMASQGRVEGELKATNHHDEGKTPIRLRDLKRLEQAGFITLTLAPLLADRPTRASTSRAREEAETETQELKNEHYKISTYAVTRETHDDETRSNGTSNGQPERSWDPVEGGTF